MARPKNDGKGRLGGRQKGTPNTIHNNLRERISVFLTDNWDEAVKAWKDIDEPKDKLKLYIDLASFGVPKLQAVQLDATINKTDSIEDDLRQLSEDLL